MLSKLLDGRERDLTGLQILGNRRDLNNIILHQYESVLANLRERQRQKRKRETIRKTKEKDERERRKRKTKEKDERERETQS